MASSPQTNRATYSKRQVVALRLQDAGTRLCARIRMPIVDLVGDARAQPHAEKLLGELGQMDVSDSELHIGMLLR